jgi:hypothetical protein
MVVTLREEFDQDLNHRRGKPMDNAPARRMFYAAPFAADGELVGVGQWRLTDLSPHWVEFCRHVLAGQGPRVRTALPAPLHHLELSFTGAEGTALSTISAAGQLAASAVYLRGKNLSQEQEALVMFVESLRKTAIVQRCQIGSQPFQVALELAERPLHIVVAWGNPAVNEEDYRLVTELGNHMAAAFLCDAE